MSFSVVKNYSLKQRKTDKYIFATDSKEQAINIYKQLHTEEKPVLLLIAEDNISVEKENLSKVERTPKNYIFT